jgi:hypothetical protein
LLTAAGIAFAAAEPVAAQVASTTPRPVARTIRTAKPPVIDGRLEDSVWSAAPAIGGFIQHEPFDGQAATERTEVRILFDNDGI